MIIEPKMRRKLTVLVGALVLALLWAVTSKVSVFHKAPEGAASPAAAGVTPETFVARAETYQPKLVVTGYTEATASLAVPAQLATRVDHWDVALGTYVAAGETLATLDPADAHAALASAQAHRDWRDQQLRASKVLAAKKLVSETALRETRAHAEMARASYETARLDVAHLAIEAPVAGVLEAQLVQAGEWVMPGTAVATLVVLDPLTVVFHASAAERMTLALGTEAPVEIEGIGTMTGKITFLAAQAAHETRTFRVELEVPNPDHKIQAGLPVRIILPEMPVTAYRVESVHLRKEAGTLGVLVMDNPDAPHFQPVTVLALENGVAWVTGLSDGLKVAGHGGAFLNAGPQEAKDASPH
jgi:multidrug efflux system membrane fusion protein